MEWYLNEVRWQEASLAPPIMFEPEAFQKQMYCIEESILVTLLGLFGAHIVTRRPGNCVLPLVTPLWYLALHLLVKPSRGKAEIKSIHFHFHPQFLLGGVAGQHSKYVTVIKKSIKKQN